jgi:hypothetical protein
MVHVATSQRANKKYFKISKLVDTQNIVTGPTLISNRKH